MIAEEEWRAHWPSAADAELSLEDVSTRGPVVEEADVDEAVAEESAAKSST